MTELIISIVGSFTSIIMLALGYLFNKKLKKQDREFKLNEEKRKKEEQDKLSEEDKREQRFKKYISEVTEELGVKLTDMEMVLRNHIEETNFKIDFINTVRNHSRQIITTLSNFLEQEHKNILSHWADTVERFGLDWYYNSRQKRSKKEVEEYLSQEIEIHIKNLDTYVDFTYDVIKIYQGKKLIFSQFLDVIKLHNKTELLKIKLVKNGFTTNKEIFDTFRDYIDDFFNDFTKVITIWNRLDVYERNTEAA